MKKILAILALIIMVASTGVYARNDGEENGNGCVNNCGHHNNAGGGDDSGSNGGNDSVNGGVRDNNVSNALSSSIAEASLGQLQTQSVVGVQGNQQSVTVNNNDNSDYSGTYKEYVAPAFAPSLTTGDCMGSASAGGSNSVMGFSFGKTYIDENCNARRDAILLSQLAKLYDADDLALASVMRLCSQPEMARVLSVCPKEPEQQESTGFDITQ